MIERPHSFVPQHWRSKLSFLIVPELMHKRNATPRFNDDTTFRKGKKQMKMPTKTIFCADFKSVEARALTPVHRVTLSRQRL